MSTNIRINKYCHFCGKLFVAKTTVTKFCSLPCAQKAYKSDKRQEKLQGNLKPISKNSRFRNQLTSTELKVKEFLSVREVAWLIGCSRQAVYLMIKSGRLRAVNLNKKKTIIKRSVIDELFEQKTETTPLPKLKPKPKVVEYDDCYNMKEIQDKFGISEKALYDLIRRNGILKIKMGKYAFVSKAEIEKIFNV